MSSPVLLTSLLFVVIGTGPKGVGKSTLAEMACSEEKARVGERVVLRQIGSNCTRESFKASHPVSSMILFRQGVVLVVLKGGAATAEAAEASLVKALANAVGFSLPEKGAPAAVSPPASRHNSPRPCLWGVPDSCSQQAVRRSGMRRPMGRSTRLF